MWNCSLYISGGSIAVVPYDSSIHASSNLIFRHELNTALEESYTKWQNKNNIGRILVLSHCYAVQKSILVTLFKHHEELFHYNYKDVAVVAAAINDKRVYRGEPPLFTGLSLKVICGMLKIKNEDELDSVSNACKIIEVYRAMMKGVL
jgi:hypothetical protein